MDHDGYSLCCMGGAIDGHLKLDARTRQLADLWSPSFAKWQTELLCRHCGQHLGLADAAGCQTVAGTLLSPTWRRPPPASFNREPTATVQAKRKSFGGEISRKARKNKSAKRREKENAGKEDDPLPSSFPRSPFGIRPFALS